MVPEQLRQGWDQTQSLSLSQGSDVLSAHSRPMPDLTHTLSLLQAPATVSSQVSERTQSQSLLHGSLMLPARLSHPLEPTQESLSLSQAPGALPLQPRIPSDQTLKQSPHSLPEDPHPARLPAQPRLSGEAQESLFPLQGALSGLARPEEERAQRQSLFQGSLSVQPRDEDQQAQGQSLFPGSLSIPPRTEAEQAQRQPWFLGSLSTQLSVPSRARPHDGAPTQPLLQGSLCSQVSAPPRLASEHEHTSSHSTFDLHPPALLDTGPSLTLSLSSCSPTQFSPQQAPSPGGGGFTQGMYCTVLYSQNQCTYCFCIRIA